MLAAIVSPSESLCESVIRCVMQQTARAQRFSAAHRPAGARAALLFGALQRDAKNTDHVTLIPVETQEEVAAVRAMGGFVCHVYGPAHPAIVIERGDLMVTSPGGYHRARSGEHCCPAALLPGELRTRLLAKRHRVGAA